jgi:diguanylate cyclase (GGDEF)-like protein/PAS domain S-box-containing protein
MDLARFQRRSLKTRITLFTLAIFLTSIWVLVFYVSQALREDMQRLLSKQQFSTVSFVAGEANRELEDRLGALGRTAGRLGLSKWGNAAALSQFLEERPVLQVQFNGGVTVLDLNGAVMAEVPPSAGRIGVNYKDVDAVAAALREGKSTIGQPTMDRKLLAPVFSMAVPIRDTKGNVIGALVGTTNLSIPSFLDQITERYYGRSGYFLLMEPKSRLTITVTGRSRIMEPLPAPGINPLFDRFVQGFDETGVTVDDNGVEILASARRIHAADWFIVAALPTEEAFALIHGMQQHMLESGLFLTLLAGGLIWWMLRREFSPMLAALKILTTQTNSNQPLQPLPVVRPDEIGELVGGFNRLLDTLGQRETALRESDERFRALHDASFGGIAIHDRGIILDCNQGLSDMTGYSVKELIGMDGIRLIAPDWRDVVIGNIQSGLDHRYDAEGLCKNGDRYHLSIRGKNIPYKGRTARVVEFRDVTERKHMEDKIRQQALHDTLTKLPNRRLFHDRLKQAMAASKRNVCHGALMFLDLDEFKPLNDTRGHEVGDLLLIEVAERLRNCVREMDTVARFGGDEFVVILTELNKDKAVSISQAGTIAETIRLALSEPYRLTVKRDGVADMVIEYECTASIGVTLFTNHEASQDEVIKGADTAMYQAKAAGRNRVRFHDDKG